MKAPCFCFHRISFRDSVSGAEKALPPAAAHVRMYACMHAVLKFVWPEAAINQQLLEDMKKSIKSPFRLFLVDKAFKVDRGAQKPIVAMLLPSLG